MRITAVLDEYVPTAAGECMVAIEGMREVAQRLAEATGQDKDPVFTALIGGVDAALAQGVAELTAKLSKR